MKLPQTKSMATESGENLPPGYPAGLEGWYTAGNGRQVFLRPVKPTDRRLLVGLFHRLSDRSIRLRFLGLLRELDPHLLDHFTLVNYVSDFAIVATLVERGEDHIIAVSRYHRDDDTGGTEFGVAVRDDWQGMGVGKEMVRRLFEAARKNGIRRVEAAIDFSNEAIPRLLNTLGYSYTWKPLRGTYSLQVEL
ncbi:MAG TPA: GNAT family N-acetyltransferase [Syntrophales bacterium]|nr:GNAT family N-acetyltransferase [Syntrophales bacterium]HPI58227.1 GNAT family N-acetyltransferase [Syntrophales bacterium]HPN25593.1 GNAT family N-acetyltransferase [Syntrophales bacterium]HQM28149.1 GNAT family N-acetyltransferase [Syntrophales bacterium]